MPNDELAGCAERIEQILGRIESLTDDRLREDMQDLIQCLLQYHGTALARLIAMCAQSGDGRSRLRSLAADDELVSSLLLLHNLHPADLESRIRTALDNVRPFLQSHGGNVELVSLTDGAVRLKLHGSCHGCPSSALTLRTRIESAIGEAAPEIVNVEVVDEQRPAVAASGFVALETLSNGHVEA